MYEKYMRTAIEEAKKGMGYTNPNPIVGAIIVKDDKVIGTGYHERYCGLHAERNAIKNCTQDTDGAVMFLTLEPCCHYGKTPPCTEAIIISKINKVVIGSLDPNPLMAGKGAAILKQNGIDVVIGVLEKECLDLNPVFFHFITTKMPYVVMKYAMTADGKIATYKGYSKWISNEESRENAAYTRHKYSSIMVGVNTVIADDPMLTSRIKDANNPLRVVCDTNLRTPIDCNIVRTAVDVPTVIATACEDVSKHRPYLDKGCEIVVTAKKNAQLDLKDLMKKLSERGIDSVLVEGGGALNFSALKAGIVNKVQAYIAPKIFGGDDAKTPVGGTGIEMPSSAFMLSNPKIKTFDEDVLIEWEVKK